MSTLSDLVEKMFDGDTDDGFVGIVNRIFNIDGTHSRSLTTLAKKTFVGSDVYIEDTLIHEDDMVPLMGLLNQMYISYVLVALNIYQSVDRYRTIRETIGRVATEKVNINYSDFDPTIALEHLFKNESPGLEEARYNKTFGTEVENSVKHLVTGRLIEFDFHVGPNDEDPDDNPLAGEKGAATASKVTVPIYIQMFPVPMSRDVAEALVVLNYPERFFRRFVKTITREIRFFRDFIFAFDLVEKHRKALAKDDTNVLNRFYQSKASKQASRIYNIITGRVKNNLANAIVVISMDTFTKVNDSSSIDLTSFVDRQKFFDESYSMGLVVVDTDHRLVDIYLNGIGHHSTLPFRAIKQAGSSKSGVDLSELMESIAKGATPKF